jgi:hypothetical protein
MDLLWSVGIYGYGRCCAGWRSAVDVKVSSIPGGFDDDLFLQKPFDKVISIQVPFVSKVSQHLFVDDNI